MSTIKENNKHCINSFQINKYNKFFIMIKQDLDKYVGLTYNINKDFIMEKQIIYYYTQEGKCPYKDWFNNLDTSIQLRIDKRVEKLRAGLYGDNKPLQKSELSELRMNFGAGYRIYYYDLGTTVVLFIAGSNKKDQKKTIQQANIYFDDYIERTK